ncbi:MAG: hypothetical protein DCC65_01660 [Planctomycetota bacterium]|nr:MAG: hypothetical protein DCC65_01660 [Planctomycetota bacterium]
MTDPDVHRDRLEDLEFKHGRTKGRLVGAMDILSDVQITIGTHAAYCKQPRNPDRPTRDIEEAIRLIDRAKQLVAELITDFDRPRQQ